MSEQKVDLLENTQDEVVPYVKNPKLGLTFNPVEPTQITSAIEKTITGYNDMKPRQAVKKLESMADNVKVRKDGMLTFIDHHLTNAVDKKIPHGARKSLFSVKSQVTSFIAISLSAVSVGFTAVHSNLVFLVPLAFTAILAVSNHTRRESLAASKEVIIPKLIVWLWNSYSIRINDDTADTIAENMLRFRSINFEDNSGEKYRVTGRSEIWYVEQVRYTANGNDYRKLKPEVTTYAPETAVQESLLVKWELVKKQKLSAEDRYAVERSKEEAYAMLQSAEVLDNIGDDSYKQDMKEAFDVLDEEMSKILNRKAHEEQSKIAASRNFIVERNRKAEPVVEALRLEK